MAAALIAALVAFPAAAHEMWLQPSTFRTSPGDPVKVTFLVGDAADVTPWTFRWEKLHSFKSYGPQGISDQQTTIRPITPATPENAVMNWQTPGTHMLVLESHHQPNTLTATRFNDYLAVDGLTPAIEHRKRNGETRKAGREIYSRRSKTLIQVGTAATNNVLQPIGQTLEIVPERNPYAPGNDTRLPVRIIYEGRALPGALVALTALGTGSKPIQKQTTDAEGRAVFDVARRGNWMVSVVWTRPIKSNKTADYDTVFTSLTFGYPGEHVPKP